MRCRPRTWCVALSAAAVLASAVAVAWTLTPVPSSDCGRSSPGIGGEDGWSNQFRHPRPYAVAQMATGHVTGRQAAGRVFCIMTGGPQEDMMWTQDAGRLLGWVAGEPHEAVWNWWSAIHHDIAFPAAG